LCVHLHEYVCNCMHVQSFVQLREHTHM
jgi:hypothetical protein